MDSSNIVFVSKGGKLMIDFSFAVVFVTGILKFPEDEQIFFVTSPSIKDY